MKLYVSIIIIVLIIIYYFDYTEYFTQNIVYNNNIPIIYKHGYSTIDNTMYTAHPLRLIDANIPDKLIKHIRLNHTKSPMYISYVPPSTDLFQKVDCPSYIYDINGSQYNLVCWMRKIIN
jgi:hypothetical protein